MELERAKLRLLGERNLERTKQRIYLPLLSAYTTLSKFLAVSKQVAMGSARAVEKGTEKLQELDDLLFKAGELYKELLMSNYAIVADDLFTILNTDEISNAKPFPSSPAWVVYPPNYQPSRVVSEGFATNYRLANGLLHSSVAIELRLDEIGRRVKEQLDELIEAEIKRKKAWIEAVENAI